MLDLLIQLFNTIVHTLQTIITIITSIPTYVGYFLNFVSTLPTFILGPVMIALIAAIIIHLKRLVF